MMECSVRYMRRCFDLARLGKGFVSPNPPVGALLVYDDEIIGEGFHKSWGGQHAEVEAIQSVPEHLRPLIPKSTLYVSLEPCCIHGKTPPCINLILDQGIKSVVVSAIDQTPGVRGRGLSVLREHGVEVHQGVLEAEGRWLVRFRNKWATTGRPWVIAKFARSKDGFMGLLDRQVWISNALSFRLVHRWRHEVDAIMVATNTALIDNPRLTTRLWFGCSPRRVILDRQGRLPHHLHVFDGQVPTIVITERAQCFRTLPVQTIQLDFGTRFWPSLLDQLGTMGITSLLVEGGSRLLYSLVESNCWDEARVFESPMVLGKGVRAPSFSGRVVQSLSLGDNTLTIWHNFKPGC